MMEIDLGNVNNGRMGSKDSNVRHALDNLCFVWVLPSADFGNRFLRHPEVKMLSFFLPPPLCDLDIGLETGSFIKQVAWDCTIQVDSSSHGNSRFLFWRLTPAVSRALQRVGSKPFIGRQS